MGGNHAEQTFSSQVGQQQLLDILTNLRAGNSNNSNDSGSKCVCCAPVLKETKVNRSDSLPLTEETRVDLEGQDTDNENNLAVKRKNKKLISGKCTRPDESDIQIVVKYAHEKLDSRHVQERIFDTLPFHLLVAGELELALLCNTPLDEREARVHIAKTICYHKQYLSDEDLCNGYDAVFKKIE